MTRLSARLRSVAGTAVLSALVVLTGSVGTAALLPARPAQAADAVTATFAPAELELAAGRSREAVLSLRNPTAHGVRELGVRLVADPGLHPTAAGQPRSLAAGSSAAVVISVERAAEAPPTGTVIAIVDYAVGSGVDAVRSTAVATLPVTAGAAPAARAAEISVSAAGGREELLQYQDTDLFFTLSNPSDNRQMVDRVTVTYPAYLAVAYRRPGGAETAGDDGTLRIDRFGTLMPGDARVVHLVVSADRPLQPGGALVHLAAHATDRVDGSVGTAVSSQQIDLQVLGESGVLTLLGVPALLFVPGLVWILVLWSLWRFVYPRSAFSLNSGDASGLIEGKVALWVFALLPSLLFPFLYPAVTRALGQERDYRKAYGLDDILYVWIMAATAAILVWGLVVLAREAYLRLFQPAEGDRPLALLAKYARRPWRRSLPTSARIYEASQRVVCLSSPHQESVLVTPFISYNTAGLSPAQQQRVAELPASRPFTLWWTFRSHPEWLSYNTVGGDLDVPTVVSKSQLAEPFDAKLWVAGTGVQPVVGTGVGDGRAGDGRDGGRK